jgi:hypothetical protein
VRALRGAISNVLKVARDSRAGREVAFDVRNSSLTKKARRKQDECIKEKSTAPAIEHVPSALEKPAVHWTERPEAFKLLVECAASLRISEKVDPDSESRTLERLAGNAVAIIEACDLAFKTAALESSEKIKDQAKVLKGRAAFSSHLDFYAGAKLLFHLDDARPKRLESKIQKLLEKDFESEPRRSIRYLDSILRPPLLDDSQEWKPDLQSFVDQELRWFKERGFSPDCLIRLSQLAKETGLATEGD